jgi:hypothetical protein
MLKYVLNKLRKTKLLCFGTLTYILFLFSLLGAFKYFEDSYELSINSVLGIVKAIIFFFSFSRTFNILRSLTWLSVK